LLSRYLSFDRLATASCQLPGLLLLTLIALPTPEPARQGLVLDRPCTVICVTDSADPGHSNLGPY